MFLIYVTVPSVEEAKLIAREVLTERVCACVNLMPQASSLYWWQGNIEESQEIVMILKTHESLVEKAMARIRALHSYDCPCITAIKIDQADNNFTKWLETSLKLA